MQENDRLERVFVGNGLVQISSVNSYAQMQSIELYEGRMLDIVFEDNREMLDIDDRSVAEKINKTIRGLYSDIEKTKKENQVSSINLGYSRRPQ